MDFPRTRLRSLRILSFLCCLWAFYAAFAPVLCEAAPPQLTTILPRGLKPGPNDVILQGANFSETSRLLLDIPGASVALKPEIKPAPNQLQMIVTIPAEAPPGAYEARIAGDTGLSNPLVLLLDAFPSFAEVEPNNDLPQAQPLTLPAAMEGRLAGVETDLFAIDGKQGQRLVVEMVGRRLGANIKPVLRLYDARRLELQFALPARRLTGDARLIATLPADGRYFIEVHDLLYRGDGNQYRLLVGEIQVSDQLFPLGGKRGSTVPLLFTGGTLTSPVPVSLPLIADPSVEVLPASLPPGALVSPLPLPVLIGESEELLEQPAADGKPQSLPLPVVVNGRLAQPNEQDLFQIAAPAGTRLRISVQSERLGMPLDGVLEIRNEQGAVLVTQDDGPGTADPDVMYVVPAGVTGVVLALSDANRRGGEEFVYRLSVAPAPSGDFELSLLTPLLNVPAGGSASVRVRAVRRDFNDPIRLKLVGDVPAGLQIAGAEIGAGVTDTLLSLTAPADAPLKTGPIRIVGEASPPEQPVLVRTARLAKQPASEAFPWMQDHFLGAVTRVEPFSLQVEPQEPALLRGVEYVAKVKVRRAEGQTGQINLAVQTSQVVLPGVQPLAPVPNLTIAENATEGVIKINIAPNVLELPLAYVVTGQLLDAKKAVVGTAESPSVATRVAHPYAVAVTQPPPELKRGARNVVPLKVTRLGSYNQPVVVALSGIPGNFRTSPVTVPPGVTDVLLPIAIAPSQAPGPLANVKLSATATPLVITPIDVPLTIGAGDPPPLLEIYDEGPDFAAALLEGAGTAAVEETDAFSGKESTSVKPEKKSRAGMPGLGVAIAENPIPGQYRFVRFAWKKKGGTGIMLELANNGQFGVAGGKGTDFRYFAGQDKYNSKGVRIAEQAPAEWIVVTRDLFADHGAFTLTGISLVTMDGDLALFDSIYLARTEADFPKPLPKP